jgi:hypothetical protein
VNIHEIQTALYTGPTSPDKFSRSFKRIEETLLSPLDIDCCLAETAGQLPDSSDFRILDLGSGSGAFFRALVDFNQAPHFLHTLAEKNLALRGIGLTDSPSSDLFNQPDPSFSPSVASGEISSHIRSYFYTITAGQSIRGFLDGKDFSTFHFVNASQFFLYLSAATLEDTMEVLIDRLERNGRLLAIGLGLKSGPLPAFQGDGATSLRTPGVSQDTDDLNVFAVHESQSFVHIPSLTLRDDWEVLKQRSPLLIAKLEKRGWIDRRNFHDTVSSLFSRYKQTKDGRSRLARKYPHRLPRDIDPENLFAVGDTEAKEALTFYVLLHDAFLKMKQVQYRRQISAKQAYMQRLSGRSDISVRILKSILNDKDDNIDAVLITKK